MQLRTRALAAALLSASVALASPPACATEVPARPLFGDTHLHSSYSYDSYTMGNRSGTPDVAYQFAKGLPVVHPSFGTRVRIGRPLDFLVVADHAEYLGVTVALFRKEPEVAGTDSVYVRSAWASTSSRENQAGLNPLAEYTSAWSK